METAEPGTILQDTGQTADRYPTGSVRRGGLRPRASQRVPMIAVHGVDLSVGHVENPAGRIRMDGGQHGRPAYILVIHEGAPVGPRTDGHETAPGKGNAGGAGNSP